MYYALQQKYKYYDPIATRYCENKYGLFYSDHRQWTEQVRKQVKRIPQWEVRVLLLSTSWMM